ncbi:MAG: hypothetical protein J5U19_07310 [Candidatus Methanoperedens sp.]|nr:hypothetical protein [Candidatus Methanoperedens sp.]
MALTKENIHKTPYDKATIVGYNRLEGVPNSPDYRKSLSAEIHDALWMLTRQWQMGEFDAEDAGTPVKTKLLVEQQKMTHMDTGNKGVFPLPLAAPLEMVVEKEGRIADLAFRIETGKLFKQILIENNLQAQLADFLAMFKIQKLELAQESSPEGKLVARIRSNRSDLQLFDALKNRVLDGFVIFEALTKPGNTYQSWIEASLATSGSTVVANAIKAGQDFRTQVDFFYGADMQKANAVWRSENLDYQFNIQTDEDPAKATIMEVKSYPGGRLDWYDFDIKQTANGNAQLTTHTFIPSPVTYPGMPKSRWWEMEENEINFGNINAKTTDLPTLILIDFALIYGNDWLMIPFPMELNNLCTIKGFLVKDVFGFHTYIPPVDTSSDISWKKWSLFSHTDNSGKSKEPLFYLAPTLLKPLEQEPLEKVSFLRDEISNMAWAFENVIPGALGKGLRGAEVPEKEEAEEGTTTKDQPLKYLLGKEVPFYQVPFIPVEIPFDSEHSKMHLQRARMPTGPEPRGVFLTEIPSPYYIHEENISRAGTTLIRRWQRTRWINGTVAQWIGREKQAGKSEGSSTLLFDLLT